ncbi:glycoside hydrolase family 99-like domain-containing protein [Flavobacterium sp.]|uniref:glycosyltransferase WbsX family protein n=1 Tax=Flavobacterium sp. TaxID=239 RepID=UPI00333F3770
MSKNLKFLAYYLPQYHPIKENDEWWGKGFTEWTNVKKAKPLFKGHHQPIVPGELGYYDLLKQPEIQERQAQLAKEYGVDGFIYYQYWFGNGKMLLEKPAEQMLQNKNVDIPFCFCWANETWKGIWHGLDNPNVLIEQTYNGEHDYIKYFNYLLPFFKDERYVKVDNKPMFHIYKLDDIPDLDLFTSVFNTLAIENGFSGVYFIATINVNSVNVTENHNIQGVVGVDKFRFLRYNRKYFFKNNTFLNKIEKYILYRLGHFDDIGSRTKPVILDYSKAIATLNITIPHKKFIPCIIPNWDNSPRSGMKSLIFKNATPKLFYEYLNLTFSKFKEYPDNPPFIILKSWNEWAEGNYLEPDQKFGVGWLLAVKEAKHKLNKI